LIKSTAKSNQGPIQIQETALLQQSQTKRAKRDSNKSGKLAGKTAIVTGAAQGIGAAIAQCFLAEGAQVLLVDRDQSALRKQVKALLTISSKTVLSVKSLALDVTAAGAGTKALKACIKAFGGCDILVNNAGITHAASFLDLKEEDFDRVLDTNLKSYFVFGQALAKHWVAAKQAGVVVNMSSVNAILAIPDQIPYVVSKGAVNQLTKVMAIALAPYNIRVNAIGPGTIATELARKAVMSSEAGRQKIMARTPLKRLGEPSEVASVALFLACQDSSYMTGQTIYPDGGRLALNYTVAID
jgi:glucose 1-dehydrogenase